MLLLMLLVGMTTSACGDSTVKQAEQLTGGSVSRSRTAIGKYGCAACHTITAFLYTLRGR